MAPHKTLCNRFIRWSRLGVLDRIFTALSSAGSQAGAHHDRRRDASESPSNRSQTSDRKDARLVSDALPAAKILIADVGTDVTLLPLNSIEEWDFIVILAIANGFQRETGKKPNLPKLMKASSLQELWLAAASE